MTKKIPYLCSMEIMLKKFCKKYKLPEKSLFDLLSHMEEVSFSKGELIIRKGDIWGIERSGFFNGREKWVKGFENQMV